MIKTSREDIFKIFKQHSNISTDSRNINKGDIFIAIKGNSFNANSFASNALNAGASFAIIDDSNFFIDKQTLLVDNSLTTLQQLAEDYRKSLDIPIIGITGTNGKTTTKELIAAVLAEQYRVVATKGNFNNHIGVPLSILSIKKDTQIAVIEMGANHRHEIDFLCNIAKPTHGLITNIGMAHLEGFGSYENIVAAKKELYDYLIRNNGIIYQNYDNEVLKSICKYENIVTYGSNENAFCKGKVITNDAFLSILLINNIVKTNLIGNYNFENAMAAITIGIDFNIDIQLINNALSTYIPTLNRSQILKTKYNTLILDAYNANPSSMSKAIENFAYSEFDNKCLIIGDMLELGSYSNDEHRKIIDFIQIFNCFKTIITLGDNFKNAIENNSKIISFNDIHALINFLINNKLENKTILLKASRGLKLESLINYL